MTTRIEEPRSRAAQLLELMSALRVQIVRNANEDPLVAGEIVRLISEVMAIVRGGVGDGGESWGKTTAIVYLEALLLDLHRALTKRLGVRARPTKSAIQRDTIDLLAQFRHP